MLQQIPFCENNSWMSLLPLVGEGKDGSNIFLFFKSWKVFSEIMMSSGYVLSVTVICISSFPWNYVKNKGMFHCAFSVYSANAFKSPWRRHHVGRISFVNCLKGRTYWERKETAMQILQLHIVLIERLGLFCIPVHWLIFNSVLCIFEKRILISF